MTSKIPQHIAIIPDGNRRWAREHGLSAFEGHKRGMDAFERIGRAAIKHGVQYLTFWGFSTENWSRSKKEVAYLMKLFRWVLTNKIDDFNRQNIKINVLGRIDAFSRELQRMIREALELTQNNTRGVINLALNYGGRAEIVDMVKKAMSLKLQPQAITERLLAKFVYAPGIPDPDLIIRTSGEQRLSGFLPWQSAYSELYFARKYWPDFNEEDLQRAIRSYQRRQRRFGQ